MSKESTARNKALIAARHAKRMATQNSRDKLYEDNQPKVARGTARNLRRVPLQLAYAKRVARGEA